jgi:hypothetical protein
MHAVTHDNVFIFPPGYRPNYPHLLFLEYAAWLGHISYPGEALASFVLCPASLRHHTPQSLGPQTSSVDSPLSCLSLVMARSDCCATAPLGYPLLEGPIERRAFT